MPNYGLSCSGEATGFLSEALFRSEFNFTHKLSLSRALVTTPTLLDGKPRSRQVANQARILFGLFTMPIDPYRTRSNFLIKLSRKAMLSERYFREMGLTLTCPPLAWRIKSPS